MEDQNEMAVVLDSYEDIFSDFDPRPYAKREISKDLLDEVQRRYTETPTARIEVRFQIPAAARSPPAEILIKRRLREHFTFEVRSTQKEINDLVKSGWKWACAGIVLELVLLASLLWLGDTNVYAQIFNTIFVVPAWFLVFSGLERAYNEPSHLKKKQIIWHRLARANFIFLEEKPPAPAAEATHDISTEGLQGGKDGKAVDREIHR